MYFLYFQINYFFQFILHKSIVFFFPLIFRPKIVRLYIMLKFLISSHVSNCFFKILSKNISKMLNYCKIIIQF